MNLGSVSLTLCVFVCMFDDEFDCVFDDEF